MLKKNEKKALTANDLRLLLRSPELYYQRLNLEEVIEDSLDLKIKKAMRTLLFAPKAFDSNYELKKAEGNSKNKIILTESELEKVHSLANKIRANKRLSSRMERGLPGFAVEASLLDKDCSVEVDYIAAENDYYFWLFHFILVETSVDSISFGESISRNDYDLEAAMHIDVMNRALKGDKKHGLFLIPINIHTGDISIFKASEELLENGRRKYFAAIERLKYFEKRHWQFDLEVPSISPSYSSAFIPGEGFKEVLVK